MKPYRPGFKRDLMQIAAAVVGTAAAAQLIGPPREHAGLGLRCDICGERCAIDNEREGSDAG